MIKYNKLTADKLFLRFGKTTRRRGLSVLGYPLGKDGSKIDEALAKFEDTVKNYL